MSVTTVQNDLSLKLAGHFREVEESLQGNSSGILNSFRKKAFHNFLSQGIPTRKSENYKYTNLQPAFSLDYQFVHNREVADFHLEEMFKCDVPQLDTHLVTMLNGWYYPELGTDGILPGGVILDSLENVARTRPDLLEHVYGSQADTASDPLVALNTVFARDGYFLYVPRNVRIEKPLQIINLLNSEKDTYIT